MPGTANTNINCHRDAAISEATTYYVEFTCCFGGDLTCAPFRYALAFVETWLRGRIQAESNVAGSMSVLGFFVLVTIRGDESNVNSIVEDMTSSCREWSYWNWVKFRPTTMNPFTAGAFHRNTRIKVRRYTEYNTSLETCLYGIDDYFFDFYRPDLASNKLESLNLWRLTTFAALLELDPIKYFFSPGMQLSGSGSPSVLTMLQFLGTYSGQNHSALPQSNELFAALAYDAERLQRIPDHEVIEYVLTVHVHLSGIFGK